MTLAAVQRWEYGGVAIWPVVEALVAVEAHTSVGWTEAQLYKVVIALFTLAALARAAIAARSGTTGAPTA